jgi:hypothetical protein
MSCGFVARPHRYASHQSRKKRYIVLVEGIRAASSILHSYRKAAIGSILVALRAGT